MLSFDHPHDPAETLREAQEREVALSHSLTEAEHALAREAWLVGRTFERAGFAFDTVTFVVTRILEGSIAEDTDPVDALHVLAALGLLDRSIAMADELLDEAA